MNRRNTIIVVFRVLAIFIFFNLLANLPVSLHEIIIFSRFSLNTSTVYRTIEIIVALLLPFAFSLLLWNKSGWIADKILLPLGMSDLWDESTASEISEVELPQESTITHLDRNEIESIVMTAIGVWVLASSIPELLRYILNLFAITHFSVDILISLVSPLAKTMIGAWLLMRSNDLLDWISKWREARMQD